MPEPDLSDVARAIAASRAYTLLERVGQGSNKETFRVRLKSGAYQALKVLRPGVSLERIDREISAMVRCSHPNIGTLSSIDALDLQSERFLFILEEFLDGGTLADKLLVDHLDASDVVRIGGALISAVEHMASLGLVHRDLKPANIMFRADGTTPVIVDFGIVRDLSQPSLTQAWLNMGPGTPYYAAPEQLLNQKELIDWRTDQFALGVLLAESALGVHPYAKSGDSYMDTVKRVAGRNGPSKDFQAECARAGLPVLATMVAPWPVQRIRTPQILRGAWTNQSIP